jgi:hypothetical protein
MAGGYGASRRVNDGWATWNREFGHYARVPITSMYSPDRMVVPSVAVLLQVHNVVNSSWNAFLPGSLSVPYARLVGP